MANDEIGPLVLDEMAYESVADAFLSKFLEQMIKDLLDTGKIDDAETLSDDDSAFVFQLCFNLLVLLEEFGGVVVDGKRRPPLLAFAAFAEGGPFHNPITSAALIVSHRRSDLHGGVSDKKILAAYAAVRTERMR